MQRAYVVWVDVNGFTRLTLINTSSGASGLFVYMIAQSNADWLNWNETGFTVNATPIPTAAQYQNVSDCASLVFTTASGDKAVLQLPSPKASIFMADQLTVDPSAIALLIAASVGELVSNSGSLATSFVGGYRRPTTRENYQ